MAGSNLKNHGSGMKTNENGPKTYGILKINENGAKCRKLHDFLGSSKNDQKSFQNAKDTEKWPKSVLTAGLNTSFAQTRRSAPSENCMHFRTLIFDFFEI